MSTRKSAWLTVVAVSALMLSGIARAETTTARLGTFEKDGRDYFALSLMPQAAADASQKNDVVILVDTSASQAGRYRVEEMAALNAMLSSFGPNDRVQLMAVDMKAVPLSAGFVAANGPEMQSALAKLNARTPLGATDLDAGLRTAASSFGGDGSARTVIYLGDAMSKANMLTDATLKKLVGDLRSEHVSVSSFVLGREQNTQLMAALANHTGGVIETAAPELPEMDAATNGQRLAASVHASVLWPNDSTVSNNVAESFPAQMPPVRTDRDSVLIGLLSNQSPVNVELDGTMNGKPVKWSWTSKPEKSSEDFAFLPKLVEMAEADKGLSLPTAGSAALRQAAHVTMNSAQQLAKLGNEALASGNFAGAQKVAEVALSRDPGNPEAIAIREAAKKGLSAAKAPATTEPELKLTGLAEPPAPSGLLAEVLAEPPGFLGRVEEERRVLSGKMQAEVDNALAGANRTMIVNPDQAENDLKLTLEGVERTPELEPEVRAQLRRKIEIAIRTARQAKIRVDQAVAVAQEQKAAAAEQERLNDALAIQTSRIKQVVDRFESLLAEQRYAVADETIVPEIHRLAPNTSIDQSVTQGGRLIRNVNEINNVGVMRDNNYLRTLFTVELSFVPFPDEPPVVYMPADQWEDLTIRRQKYKAVDLGKQGGAEQRIYTELGKNTTIDVVEMPLKDVVLYLTETHNIPIVLSLKKLEEASVSADTPVTKSLRSITLRSALRLILKELELTYVVRDEVLQITTPEDAESQLITKVYPVGDLVIPVMSGGGGMMGGMGGMMGGMGGGMMGGMGGGMGGMGGGMGGMGGGLGGMGGGMGGMGMGGGMGGGMFAVEDELTLGTKKPAAAAPEAPAPAANPQPAPAIARSAPAKGKRITVKRQGDESSAAAWD
ncbi:MAG TPA: VWA domain-containing protein, partial [Pirellulaceae bacterium]